MNYTYYNPGKWQEGICAKPGDIFQVTAQDARNNSEYKEGDYYRVIGDAAITIKNEYYPPSGKSNAVWEYSLLPSEPQNWDGILDLKVAVSGVSESIQNKDIYSNGLHMLAVNVFVTPSTNDPINGQIAIDVDPYWIVKQARLIDYETGVELTFLTNPPTLENPLDPGQSGWFYSTKHNDFYDPSGSGFTNESINGEVITFYVVVNDNDLSDKQIRRIGVSVVPYNKPDISFSVGSASGNFQESIGTITANVPPTSFDIYMDALDLRVEHVRESGQLSDDGSDFERPQPINNFWRQVNFYITLKNKKIKTAIVNKQQDSMYQVGRSNGFNTECYLLNFGDTQIDLDLWGNKKYTFYAAYGKDSICLLWVSYFKPDYSTGSSSYSASVVIVDTDGNKYPFTPKHRVPDNYSKIISIKDGDVRQVIEEVEIKNEVPVKKYFAIKNEYYGWLFPHSKVDYKGGSQRYVYLGSGNGDQGRLNSWYFLKWAPDDCFTSVSIFSDYYQLGGLVAGSKSPWRMLQSGDGWADPIAFIPIWSSYKFYLKDKKRDSYLAGAWEKDGDDHYIHAVEEDQNFDGTYIWQLVPEKT